MGSQATSNKRTSWSSGMDGEEALKSVTCFSKWGTIETLVSGGIAELLRPGNAASARVVPLSREDPFSTETGKRQRKV